MFVSRSFKVIVKCNTFSKTLCLLCFPCLIVQRKVFVYGRMYARYYIREKYNNNNITKMLFVNLRILFSFSFFLCLFFFCKTEIIILSNMVKCVCRNTLKLDKRGISLNHYYLYYYGNIITILECIYDVYFGSIINFSA